jgi:LPS-assembly lipoprotein
MKKRVSKRLCFLLIVSILTGCGFHLKGFLALNNIQSIYIEDQVHSPRFTNYLSSTLNQLGVRVNTSSNEAQYTLTLLKDNHSSTISSVSSSTNTRQYILTHQIEFELVKGNKLSLIPPTWIISQRTLTVNANQILGSDSQSVTLKEDMIRELSYKLITRLNSLTQVK